MDTPVYYSGAPFDFDVTMSNEIEADAIISVSIMTYRFGRHLTGASDGDSDADGVTVGPAEGAAFKVSVTGEKCRLLSTGFVHVRVVVTGADGKVKDVQELIVGEIIIK